MKRDRRPSRVEPFTPLVSESRRRLVLRIAVAPLLWLVALVITAVVLSRTRAIELGLLIAFASMLVLMAVLSVLRAARDRERRRYGTRR